MDVRLECYLRDQVISGTLSVTIGRALDQLNANTDPFLVLRGATIESLHFPEMSLSLEAARVHKEALLLVVPVDSVVESPPLLRAGWVEKVCVPVNAGLGPFNLKGNLHSRPGDLVCLESVVRAEDGRAFVPATEGTMSCAYRPGWTAQAEVVFVRRAAISYLSLQGVEGDQSTASRSRADGVEAIYRRYSGEFQNPRTGRGSRA